MAAATSPVIEGLEEHEGIVPGEPPDYKPLPALFAERYMTVMKWKLNDAEMKRVMETGEVYLQVWTGGEPLQPALVSGLPPVVKV